MNSGITRWKIVPSYSGVLCLVTPLAGFFQSFLPVANPMKFSTVIGVSFSNSVQRRVPAEVLNTATGLPEGAAGFLTGAFDVTGGLGFAAGTACPNELAPTPRTAAQSSNRRMNVPRRNRMDLRVRLPSNCTTCGQKRWTREAGAGGLGSEASVRLGRRFPEEWFGASSKQALWDWALRSREQPEPAPDSGAGRREPTPAARNQE